MGLASVTAEEFEARYAARSGVTVAWLHAHGRYTERCDCGWGSCEGWGMGHQQEDAIVEDSLRFAPPPPGGGDERGEQDSGDEQPRKHDSGL